MKKYVGFCSELLIVALLAALGSVGALAQEAELSDEEAEAQFMRMVERLGWEREGEGSLGDQAEISIPEGYRFSGKSGTNELMKLMGNPHSPDRVGTLAPEGLEWFVVFSFEDSGYVKDDEKDDLDPKKTLKMFQESQEAANEQRAAMGMGKLFVTGWAKEPFYNETTNNLEWALELEDEEGFVSVNYKTKLLGRNGVIDSVLVCGPDELEDLLPTYQELITGFEYTDGNSYAEYKKGDKVAEYGLMGLMVGGGAFAAAKLGLLGWLGVAFKKVWYLFVAAIVGIKTWLGRLFSRNKNQYTVDQ